MRAVRLLSGKPLLAPVVIALAIACGLALGQREPSVSEASALEWLDAPRPVAQFSLRSDRGDFTASSLRGHWQLLVLGFTHCPDLCPTTLSHLAALRTAVADEHLRVVFVSVDPLRDSPQQLAGFVGFFGEEIIGVTGADDQLHRLAASLGMDFRRDGPVDKPVISHSPTIALIGPDGVLLGRLRPGFDTQQAAREVAARIRAAS